MNRLFRFWRYFAFFFLPILAIMASSMGPDGWREPVARIVWLAWSALAVTLVHTARKAWFPYADTQSAWRKAMEDPIGAGLLFLGVSIVTAVGFLALTQLARAQDVRTYVPANAVVLAPMVGHEIDSYYPTIPMRSYVGALIEQESCISLKHSRCWNPRAQLKTAREEGGGLGQLTRAYAADGSMRFDALAEVKTLAPAALADLSWATVYSRADLGVRAILVKLRDCDARIQRLGTFAAADRVAFCDAAYNGGMAGLATDRRMCGMTTGCNPSVWFANVERTSGKSRTKWQGYGASAFDINREHVRNTLQVRRPKYVALLGA